MRDCNHRSRLLQFWWTSSFFFSRCCGLSVHGGVDTTVATCYLSCGGSCSSVWEYLARCNLWFPGVATVGGYLCSMGQDAQHEVGSTVRCVSKRVLQPLRKKPIFLDQSNAQFVANVFGNAATRTSFFLHLESAVESRGIDQVFW